MKIMLPILLQLFLSTARGNATSDTLKVGDTLPAQLLSGSWISTDPSHAVIEFTFTRKQLKLVAGPGSAYDFFLKDSLFVNPLNGVLIKWPPDDCAVRLIDNAQMEITYTIFGGKPVTIRYERVVDRDGSSHHQSPITLNQLQ